MNPSLSEQWNERALLNCSGDKPLNKLSGKTKQSFCFPIRVAPR
ncbi:hypothetical protein FM106_06755 [Brachybacterium faecium]|nr:hypothetical protein FM106_06755 [Brachybacterium faecium]